MDFRGSLNDLLGRLLSMGKGAKSENRNELSLARKCSQTTLHSVLE